MGCVPIYPHSPTGGRRLYQLYITALRAGDKDGRGGRQPRQPESRPTCPSREEEWNAAETKTKRHMQIYHYLCNDAAAAAAVASWTNTTKSHITKTPALSSDPSLSCDASHNSICSLRLFFFRSLPNSLISNPSSLHAVLPGFGPSTSPAEPNSTPTTHHVSHLLSLTPQKHH